MRSIVVLLALSLSVAGQVAYVVRTPSSSAVTEGFYLPTAQYAAGENSLNPRVPTLNLPHFFSGAVEPTTSPTPTFLGQGGHAVNQVTGLMLSSDGFSIWEEPHPLYPQSSALLPPVSGPQGLMWGYPSFFPQISAYPPPIMGLSVDDGSNTLWMCDLVGFRSFGASYPYAPLSSPYVQLTSLLNSFPQQQWFTGIAFDPASSSLWLCDNQGFVYHVDTLGNAIGAQPVASIAAPLKGIAVNSSTGTSAVPPPGCSTQQIGVFRVIATDGARLFDALTGASVSLAMAGDAYGLAFSSDGQYSGGETTGNTATLRISRPLITSVPSVLLHLNGAAPNQSVALAWGRCPKFPGFPFMGGNLRVDDGFITGLTTDWAGDAMVPIPSGLPAGFQFTVQWAYQCPCAGVLTWSLTDALTLTFGMP